MKDDLRLVGQKMMLLYAAVPRQFGGYFLL